MCKDREPAAESCNSNFEKGEKQSAEGRLARDAFECSMSIACTSLDLANALARMACYANSSFVHRCVECNTANSCFAVRPAEISSLILRRDLILLQLAVRHFVGPG